MSSSLTAQPEQRSTIVPDAASGRRFDAVLAELFPEFSRSRLAEWIKSGDALLDGNTVRPRDPVRGGETVTLAVMLETQTDAEPEDIPLAVLHEDADVFVLDKPAGLVVHPGAGNHSGTLVNALLFRDPSLAALPRAGIVHRLDKDTSGVMVVARTLQAHAALVAQLSARAVHRQYLAIVVGALVSGGTANAAIDRHPRDRLRMAVRDDGRDAITHYRLRERFRAHTALVVRERFQPLTAAWRKRGYELGLGVGIAVGYATLGRIGFEGRYDYGAIGNVVIMASRLSSGAAPDQILLTQRAYAMVEGLIEVEEVDALTLKGMSRPVPAHNVLALHGA